MFERTVVAKNQHFFLHDCPRSLVHEFVKTQIVHPAVNEGSPLFFSIGMFLPRVLICTALRAHFVVDGRTCLCASDACCSGGGWDYKCWMWATTTKNMVEVEPDHLSVSTRSCARNGLASHGVILFGSWCWRMPAEMRPIVAAASRGRWRVKAADLFVANRECTALTVLSYLRV